ncbi:hypothetical protein L1987_83405 [Smallanthus sonchifolius]|uniref:Uncharacterized protein n=1 Tax=Smallanthus sonchifolius TaxID=185202 RepID=A0ACB8YCY6_9ASTR|nr:hypothetical protein L1987_83405 [Smallanthus sonchifolius]
MDELREAVETAELVDAHVHNIVALDSSVRFLSCFSEASGKALSDVPSTLNFKRSLRDIAELYGFELSRQGVQEFRSHSDIQTISKMCFKAAGISTVLIDDGLMLDKMLGIEQHRDILPFVGRILRIERLAEAILDEARSSYSYPLLKIVYKLVSRRFVQKYIIFHLKHVFLFPSVYTYMSLGGMSRMYEVEP